MIKRNEKITKTVNSIVTFNPWIEAMKNCLHNGESFSTMKLYQILLFCFRIDINRDIENEHDREHMKNTIDLVKHTPGASHFVDILSLNIIPKFEDISDWRLKNYQAAKKLEVITVEYFKMTILNKSLVIHL
jgi:hypothetical protein